MNAQQRSAGGGRGTCVVVNHLAGVVSDRWISGAPFAKAVVLSIIEVPVQPTFGDDDGR